MLVGVCVKVIRLSSEITHCWCLNQLTHLVPLYDLLYTICFIDICMKFKFMSELIGKISPLYTYGTRPHTKLFFSIAIIPHFLS